MGQRKPIATGRCQASEHPSDNPEEQPALPKNKVKRLQARPSGNGNSNQQSAGTPTPLPTNLQTMEGYEEER